MSSRPKTKYAVPVAIRLTLWYAGIFTISSLLAFSIFYFSIAKIIYDRTDEDMLEDVQELSVLLEEEGYRALKREFKEEAESDGADEIFFRLIGRDGTTRFSTDLTGWPNLASPEKIVSSLAKGEPPAIETTNFPNREYATRIVTGNLVDDHILQIGQSFKEDDEFLEIFRSIFSVTLPIIMVIAGLFGWFMARKALQGVREVTAAAIDISEGDLSRRVHETGRGDEIDLLANTFNTMLDRIQTLITSMQDMTDNIAHDLRNPLTRIRGIAETSLLNTPSADDFKFVIGNTIEECDRLLHMINTMLDITETESGTGSLPADPIDLCAIVDDACDLFQPLAEDKNINFSCSCEKPAIVQGNKQQLQRMLGNLIDNALKYTGENGKVKVRLFHQEAMIVLDIADSGIGIDKNDIDSIFKRFYRCDASRTKTGSGLGLSLVQAIVKAHKGEIGVTSESKKGSNFRVTLPAYNK